VFPFTFRAILWGSALFAQSPAAGLDLPRSAVAFSVSHMGFIVVPGVFHRFQGRAQWEAGATSPTAIEIWVEAASVDTRLKWRDDALRGPEFFHIAKHPQVVFVSKLITPGGMGEQRAERATSPGTAGKLSISGDLTMRGLTLPISFTLTQAPDNPRRFSGQFPVRRLPYGIGLKYAPPFIGTDVIMKLDVVWASED
jgi:polyisoprenoid-binding protein YceI